MIKALLFLLGIGVVTAILMLCFIYVNYIFNNKKGEKDDQR